MYVSHYQACILIVKFIINFDKLMLVISDFLFFINSTYIIIYSKIKYYNKNSNNNNYYTNENGDLYL